MHQHGRTTPYFPSHGSSSTVVLGSLYLTVQHRVRRLNLNRVSSGKLPAASKLSRSVHGTPAKTEGSGTGMRRSQSAATVPRGSLTPTPRQSMDGRGSPPQPGDAHTVARASYH